MDNIEWLAGLLDAEGCFSKEKNSLAISVDMRDQDVVERISSFTNNSKVVKRIPKNINHSIQYRWKITGLPAISICQQVYPFVCQRRKNAIKNAIENWENERKIQLIIPETKPITMNYVAGLIEGDGTMFVNKNNNGPRIAVGTIDYDMIDNVYKLLQEGHIYTVERKIDTHNTLYRLDIYKREAIKNILTEIYPLLGTRRKEQADRCLSVC